jgi:hypothetical protein
LSDVLPKIDWRGKQVLEIGTGVAARPGIINRGGIYTGVNIDQASVEVTAKALKYFRPRQS